MSAHYARTPVGAYASPHAAAAASPYLASAHASPVVDEPGGSNVAGFGARKFAEKQRRAADAARAHAERDAQRAAHAEWERRQYARELARYEEEKRAYDEEERMRWEEHAAWQAAEQRRADEERARDEWEREEAERQRREAQRAERRRTEEQEERRQRAEDDQRRQRTEDDQRRQRAEDAERRQRAESDERRRAADERQRRTEAPAPSPAALQRNESWSVLSSNDAWARNAAAVAAYDANRESGTHAAARVPPVRSDTLDSVATSSAHLAYSSERESGTERRSQASGSLDSSSSSGSSRTLNRSGSSDTVPSSCSSKSLGIGLGIAASRAPRETIYEDDFEEADSAEELDGDDEADVTLRASKPKTSRYTQYGGDGLDLLDVSLDGVENHGLRASKLLAPRPPSPPPVPRGAQGGRRSMVRATTYEPLPKAKCADCGESLAFEDLVAHTCHARLDDGALSPRSPLPPGSVLSSPLPPCSGLNTPLIESPTEERSRSPFFDRYAKLEPKADPRSPALPEANFSAASRSRSRDELPSPRTVEERRRANTSPLATPHEEDTAAAAAAAAQALIVADRKRHIEAQRQAARNGGAGRTATAVAAALRLQTGAVARSPTKTPLPLDTDSCSSDCSHKRDTPSASSSVSSVCSSLLGTGRDGAKASRSPGGTAMTPSSSYGRFSDREARDREPASKLRTSPTKSSPMLGRRPEIDLGGIEDLMAGLVAEEPSVPVKRGGQRERSRERTGAADARSRPSALQLDTGALASEQRRRKEKLQRLCSVCLCSLSKSKTPFVERDGRLLCAADYAELYLPKCRKCTKPVERQAVKSSDGALRGIFHRACFCCFQCDAVFADGTFYVFENAPYCARHYHTLNGTLCHGCGDGIEGQCRQTEAGERYHPRCLTCQVRGGVVSKACGCRADPSFAVRRRRRRVLCRGARRLLHHRRAAPVRVARAQDAGGAREAQRRAQPRQGDAAPDDPADAALGRSPPVRVSPSTIPLLC
jgi:hypothetical protein